MKSSTEILTPLGERLWARTQNPLPAREAPISLILKLTCLLFAAQGPASKGSRRKVGSATESGGKDRAKRKWTTGARVQERADSSSSRQPPIPHGLEVTQTFNTYT